MAMNATGAHEYVFQVFSARKLFFVSEPRFVLDLECLIYALKKH